MSSDEAEFDEDDDVPLASLKENGGENGEGRSPRKRKAVNYTDGDDEVEEEEEEEEEESDDSDESDDEDDVPLASLKQKSPSKAKAKPKAKTPASKKKAKPAPKSPTKSTSSSGGSKSYDSASAALYESDCKKGMLIQKLLCRWWYAITWPDPATLPEEPPKHYDYLDGFPGVYICTSGDKVGHILDMRDAEQCPSFQNYAKKSSKELKELLLQALEEQLRQLIEHEGGGTPTEKQIKEDIQLVKRIKVDEADKEAVKVLKAAKMKI